MIGLNTEKVDFKNAPDSNLVFLLDVSGSMADANKLPLLTKAFSLFTNELDKKDKVSIVTYAGEDKVLLEGISGDQKDTILTALENIEANGSTNGSAGIETAYKFAKDVKLQAPFNPDVVKEYRLIGYENRVMEKEDFEDDIKDAGEIGSGHTVTVLYEVKMTDIYRYSNILDRTELTKEDTIYNWMTLKIRFKKPEGKKSTELSYVCDNGNYSTEVSNDLSFAMAVAEFGMILRKSPYIGEGSLNQVVQLAKQTDISKDMYKSEFVKLVNTVVN